METIIPKTSIALSALLRADFTTQWRNRRSVVLVLLVPIIIIISWKGLVEKFGGPFILSNGIGIGLTALGLMGYSNSIARDRDKGVFQRLRVAPVPSWAIMVSRLVVQLLMMVLITTVVFVIGKISDGISLSFTGYLLTYFTAFVGGAVYLSLGQVIVGLIKNPETVNSTSRLVYIAFIMIGMFSALGAFDKFIQLSEILRWLPYSTVNKILAAGMAPASWNADDTYALLATIGYTIVLTIIGIKKFKWESK
jgi:ABC-2 type transport system permease protein